MTPEETAIVLAKCAAVDRRTVGRADVMAWHEIIGDLPLAVALEAVKRWYTNNRDWIMPSDVVGLAVDIQREQRAEAARQRQIERQRETAQLLPAPETGQVTDRSHEIAAGIRRILSDRKRGRASA